MDNMNSILDGLKLLREDLYMVNDALVESYDGSYFNSVKAELNDLITYMNKVNDKSLNINLSSDDIDALKEKIINLKSNAKEIMQLSAESAVSAFDTEDELSLKSQFNDIIHSFTKDSDKVGGLNNLFLNKEHLFANNKDIKDAIEKYKKYKDELEEYANTVVDNNGNSYSMGALLNINNVVNKADQEKLRKILEDNTELKNAVETISKVREEIEKFGGLEHLSEKTLLDNIIQNEPKLASVIRQCAEINNSLSGFMGVHTKLGTESTDILDLALGRNYSNNKIAEAREEIQYIKEQIRTWFPDGKDDLGIEDQLSYDEHIKEYKEAIKRYYDLKRQFKTQNKPIGYFEMFNMMQTGLNKVERYRDAIDYAMDPINFAGNPDFNYELKSYIPSYEVKEPTNKINELKNESELISEIQEKQEKLLSSNKYIREVDKERIESEQNINSILNKRNELVDYSLQTMQGIVNTQVYKQDSKVIDSSSTSDTRLMEAYKSDINQALIYGNELRESIINTQNILNNPEATNNRDLSDMLGKYNKMIQVASSGLRVNLVDEEDIEQLEAIEKLIYIIKNEAGQVKNNISDDLVINAVKFKQYANREEAGKNFQEFRGANEHRYIEAVRNKINIEDAIDKTNNLINYFNDRDSFHFDADKVKLYNDALEVLNRRLSGNKNTIKQLEALYDSFGEKAPKVDVKTYEKDLRYLAEIETQVIGKDDKFEKKFSLAQSDYERYLKDKEKSDKQYNNEQKRIAKEQADEAKRIAKAQADEAKRVAREEADEKKRIAKEQADEAKRLADEKKRIDKEQSEEAKRIAKEEADEAKRIAKEKADAEKEAKRKELNSYLRAREQQKIVTGRDMSLESYLGILKTGRHSFKQGTDERWEIDLEILKIQEQITKEKEKQAQLDRSNKLKSILRAPEDYKIRTGQEMPLSKQLFTYKVGLNQFDEGSDERRTLELKIIEVKEKILKVEQEITKEKEKQAQLAQDKQLEADKNYIQNWEAVHGKKMSARDKYNYYDDKVKNSNYVIDPNDEKITGQYIYFLRQRNEAQKEIDKEAEESTKRMAEAQKTEMNNIKSTINMVVKAVKTAVNAIKTYINTLVSIVKFGANAVKSYIGLIGNIFTGLVSTVQRIVQLFGNFGNRLGLTNKQGGLLKGTFTELKSKIDLVTGAFKRFTNNEFIKEGKNLLGSIQSLNIIIGKKLTQSTIEWANELERGFGISASGLISDLRELTAVVKGLGMSAENTNTASKNLTMVANTLSTLMGYDSKTVMSKITSGMKGMTASIDDLGLSVRDAQMDAFLKEIKASEEGYENIGTVFSNLSEKQRIYVRYAAIMKQVLDNEAYSAENFKKSLDSVTGRLSIFTNRLRTLKTYIGNLFLHILDNVIEPITHVVNALIDKIALLSQKLLGIDITVSPDSNKNKDTENYLDNLKSDLEDVEDQANKTKGALDGWDHVSNLSNSGKDDFDYSKLMDLSGDYADQLAEQSKELQKEEGNYFDRVKRSFDEWIGNIKKKIEELKLGFDFGYIKQRLDWAVNLFKIAFNRIKKFIQTTGLEILQDLKVGQIINKISDVIFRVSQLIAEVSKTLTGAFTDFYNNGFNENVKSFGDVIISVIDKVINKLTEWTSWWRDEENKKLITDKLTEYKNKFSEFIKTVSLVGKVLFKGLDSETLTSADPKIIPLLQFVYEIHRLVPTLIDMVGQLIDRFKTFTSEGGFKELSENITGIIDTIINNKDSIVELISTVSGAVVDIAEALSGKVKNLLDFVLDNKDIIIAFIKDAKNLIVTIIDNFEKLVTLPLKAVINPSWAGNDLAEVLLSNPDAQKGASNFAGITKTFSTILNPVGGIGRLLGEGLVSGIQKGITSVKGLTSKDGVFTTDKYGNLQLSNNYGAGAVISQNSNNNLQNVISDGISKGMKQALNNNANNLGQTTIEVCKGGVFIGDEAGIRKLANKINTVNTSSRGNIANINYRLS